MIGALETDGRGAERAEMERELGGRFNGMVSAADKDAEFQEVIRNKSFRGKVGRTCAVRTPTANLIP
jgi:hypothetical protein